MLSTTECRTLSVNDRSCEILSSRKFSSAASLASSSICVSRGARCACLDARLAAILLFGVRGGGSLAVVFEAADLALRDDGASGRCMKGAGVSLRLIIAAAKRTAVLSGQWTMSALETRGPMGLRARAAMWSRIQCYLSAKPASIIRSIIDGVPVCEIQVKLNVQVAEQLDKRRQRIGQDSTWGGQRSGGTEVGKWKVTG